MLCNKKIKNDKSAENITRELYQFLQEQKLEEKIAIKIKKLEDKRLLDLANEYKTSYKTILDILDEIIIIFKK